jgi:hypothetical protein
MAMPGPENVFTGRVLADGITAPRAVYVSDGMITGVEPWQPGDRFASNGAQLVALAADEVLIPGLVDTHVHVNEPGRTEWEGFATATRAAAGGITTIFDVPLNSVPRPPMSPRWNQAAGGGGPVPWRWLLGWCGAGGRGALAELAGPGYSGSVLPADSGRPGVPAAVEPSGCTALWRRSPLRRAADRAPKIPA